MKKLLSLLVAVLMLCALTLSVFAEDLYVLEEASGTAAGSFADGVEVSDWYTSVITEYMFPDVMADFLEAIETDGAQIEITADVECSGVLLQAYADGAYTSAATTDKVSSSTDADGNYVVVFDAATVIAAYTDAGLSMDDVLNFGVDFNSGAATIYGIKVTSESASVAATEPAEAEPEEPEEAETTTSSTEETASSPDTGIVLAVLPMAAAMAAVVISKKR
ncbi:MAG: hypothetical protein LIO72_04575 [Ruminococcus sp.]|nr:hypothetical protein [Ruminococcus sp.]